ncbi:MAG: PhzF family phenazine biosynthesis protein [Anaerolineae bacterium]|nr:PhzF family phenazine biosynthesis protein [Anaerolineae bacterium]
MQFYIVDVFTETKYAGNQLAVIRDAAGLSTETMQAIALEMNYSETTFILGDAARDGGYDVRIFTPAEEVPFAGHPTLGTAFIIQQKIIQSPVDKVILNLKVGPIPVTFSYRDQQPGELWMHQRPPDFGETFTAETLAAVLNLDIEDIDPRFPIQDVSTGLPFIIVPLQSLSATKRCRVNLDRFEQLIKTSQRARAVFIFCAETYQAENDLNARMFSPYYSVDEDPATGSANGCLAGYLVKHRYFGSDHIDVRVEQGYEIKRPSLLKLQAQANGDHIDVFVGGGVVLVAEGQLV